VASCALSRSFLVFYPVDLQVQLFLKISLLDLRSDRRTRWGASQIVIYFFLSFAMRPSDLYLPRFPSHWVFHLATSKIKYLGRLRYICALV
jgi:hypothetical protein